MTVWLAHGLVFWYERSAVSWVLITDRNDSFAKLNHLVGIGTVLFFIGRGML